LTGRTRTDHIAVFDGNERLIGQTVGVRVDEATAFTLFGTVVTGEQVGVVRKSAEESRLPGQPLGQQRMELPLV
jgi:hypothetical protein